MRRWLSALLLIASPVFAAPVPQLKMLAEHAVDGMVGGNLSGLASCGGVLWTVSDRDDALLYRLDTSAAVWKAEGQAILVPPVPDSGLPFTLVSMAKASALVRGGSLDFEGVTCDGAGNRYLVSEGYASVLQVPVTGAPNWLNLPKSVVQQARDSGLLQDFNAIFEGIAINPAGDQLWLAAEREKRGLLSVRREQGAWDCKGSCVMLSEGGKQIMPAQMGSRSVSKDFSDISLFEGKLFTLERAAYQVCRRNLDTGAVERCWSFADDALVPAKRYAQKFGLAEALVIDAEGAWIGVDNNFGARADGEKRPIVWRFAAPKEGWSAKP
ncbi:MULTISPECIES: esterase-like activity of phytase family protein [unclassified Pseudomonas]|uniref:esterase-like activity of phytase family protein n=1 Tax=unclassified Pseudomonas TaxID=196821 RepID=UPI002AC95C98|nr:MULTISPECIES: esterase-like activity of phytase family protein [unclassified Pseudomonas]MEB0042603.1 esterase-like activity of phytase family protein [Pseudomonas sp. MH10]MEB0079200.1 esterase-like activity of phytase family protein [Pseudomonas sp. MH10out]MEB0094211.1 esterase-like activity of phytase family protein [Pseudomonas sp. CCI4.2]MEB0104252.1 esterase-like activity of phytase family protein [Pseudomonas sp. CCI3.2]MEB0122827.1 esterase-like activity of phytase family protein [